MSWGADCAANGPKPWMSRRRSHSCSTASETMNRAASTGSSERKKSWLRVSHARSMSSSIAVAAASPASLPVSAPWASSTRCRKVRRQRLRSFGETRRSPPMYAPDRARETKSRTCQSTVSGLTAFLTVRVGTAGVSSVSIRSRVVALPRQYRFHSAFFGRSSSRPASLPKNSARFIRFTGMRQMLVLWP